ncbi:MAG: type IV secretory system conjugative DNA transfer family protein [Pseudomonadota bacterium]
MFNRPGYGQRPGHAGAYLGVLLGAWRAGSLLVGGVMKLSDMIHAKKMRAQQRAGHDDNEFRIVNNVSTGRLGDARLFSPADAMAEDMVMPAGGEGGLYIGYFMGAPLRWPGDEHLFIMGAAGSFKSWSMTSVNVISTALGGRSADGASLDAQSCFVLDLKGEIYAATHEGHEAITGVKPARIAPFEPGGMRVNLLGDLVRQAIAGSLSKEDCYERMMAFMPPDKLEGRNGWIGEEAVRIFAAIMGYLASEPDRREQCHLAELADLSSLTITAFLKTCEAMAESSALEGWIAEEAGISLSKYAPLPDGAFAEQTLRQWGYAFETAKTVFQPYSKGGKLRAFVTVDSTLDDPNIWDPADLKRRPSAAYLIFPPKYVRSHGAFAAVLVDYVICSIRDARGQVRTNLILDEIGNFARAMAIPDGLKLLRSYGIRIIAAVQDRLSLEEYKTVGGAKLFESQSVQLLWTVQPDHAREIENRAGYRTVVSPNYQTSLGVHGPSGTKSGGEVKVPVLSVHDCGLVGKHHAIFIAPGQNVGIFDRPIYSEIPWVAPFVKDIRKEPGHGGLDHG